MGGKVSARMSPTLVVICGRIFNQMRISDFLIILLGRARADHGKESCKGLEMGVQRASHQRSDDAWCRREIMSEWI